MVIRGSANGRGRVSPRAKSAFLDAVERSFGIGARMKAAEMMDADGKGKPLNSRIIKAIDEAINPYTHGMIDRPEAVPLDETNGEVCVSGIPRSAIVGWVTFKGRRVIDIDGSNHSRLSSMQNRIDWDKDYTIKFNPDYRP